MSDSIGNLKNSGLKGNNWPWQYKMLLGLQGIIDTISTTAGGTEYEAELVSIECPPGPVPPNPHAGAKIYLEVRVWDSNTSGFTNISYYLPGDNTQYPASDFAGCTITYLSSGDASEATLQAIDTNTTGVVRTTGMLRPTTGPADLNTVQATFYSVSVANVGAANGTVLGQTIKPNESLNFNADAIGNSFNTFAYDATGTEFIIIYVY